MNIFSHALAIIATVFALLAIESPLLQQFHQSLFAPDIALVAVLWLALHFPLVPGVLTALVIGFLKDGFVMAVPVGMYTEIMVVVFLVSRFFASKVPVRGLSSLLVASILLAVFSALLFALLSLLFDPRFESYRLIFRLMVPVALVTAPFAPAVFFILDRLDGLFARANRRDSLFGS